MNIDFMYIAIVLVVILLSMTFHEAMHAYAGYWLGDDTARLQGRLSLNPIKHIDPFMTIILPILLALAGGPIFGGAKPVQFNPNNVKWGEWGPAVIAAVGPLTNLVIAFLSYGVWVLCGSPLIGYPHEIFYALISVNLGFFLFNVIPVPPLDGSRVLYALAPEFIRRFMEMIERYGLFIVLGLVILGGSVLNTYLITAINFFFSVFAHIYGVA